MIKKGCLIKKCLFLLLTCGALYHSMFAMKKSKKRSSLVGLKIENEIRIDSETAGTYEEECNIHIFPQRFLYNLYDIYHTSLGKLVISSGKDGKDTYELENLPIDNKKKALFFNLITHVPGIFYDHFTGMINKPLVDFITDKQKELGPSPGVSTETEKTRRHSTDLSLRIKRFSWQLSKTEKRLSKPDYVSIASNSKKLSQIEEEQSKKNQISNVINSDPKRRSLTFYAQNTNK
ncbi:MAG: hypothetical protein WA432_01590 [Candidatus Babeliaceae bacterium]